MFFNKLKEEMQDWVYERLAKLEDRITRIVAEAIIANSKTPKDLIEKYKHTQWLEISPIVRKILEDRFNLTVAIPLAIYKGNKTVYSNTGYVGDTLKDACDKERKESNQEEKKYISIPTVTDKDKLNLISVIIEHQKSTVKAIKEIKEVLKDVE